MAKNAKKLSSEVMKCFQQLREHPEEMREQEVLGVTAEKALSKEMVKRVSGRSSVAATLNLDPGHFSRILAGKTPVGPAVIGRAVVFLPPAAASRLISAYLKDEVAQIETHRQRVAKKYRRSADGRFNADVSVTKIG